MDYEKKRQQQRQEFLDNLMASNAKMRKAIEFFLSEYDDILTDANDMEQHVESLRESIL